MRIGIVILNFLAYKDTIECVTSIGEQTYQSYEIVIVDNNSSNGSYEILRERFKNESNITVINTNENLGFAKGNNIGISNLKDRGIYNVLVINGDTVFHQKEYLERLSQLKLENNIAIVGGRIISKDRINQNTLKVSLLNQSNLFVKRMELAILKLIYVCRMDRFFIKFKRKNKNKQIGNAPIENGIKVLDPNKEMLHGAALFFTEIYLKDYVGFYPKTFLYYEEDFLALICRKLNFREAYVDELSIYHKEDASSDLLLGNNHRKAILFKIGIIKRNITLMSEALDLSPEKLKNILKGKAKI